MKLNLLAGLLVFAIASPAFAIFEARITYGQLASSPDIGSLYTGTNGTPSDFKNVGVGGDALIFIPFTGLGVGLRYENLGVTESNGTVSAKTTAQRTAILLNYRFIDTIFHVGPMLSYGTAHTSKIDVYDSKSGQAYSWSTGSSSSYSIGLDANVTLLFLEAGAEVGYEYLKFIGMQDSTGTSTKTPDIDMSGTYGKVYVGLSF